MKISMKLFYQYMAIFFNFLLTSNHFHLLQVENCDSNSRLVVDEDYGKLRLERVNTNCSADELMFRSFRLEVRTLGLYAAFNDEKYFICIKLNYSNISLSTTSHLAQRCWGVKSTLLTLIQLRFCDILYAFKIVCEP